MEERAQLGTFDPTKAKPTGQRAHQPGRSDFAAHAAPAAYQLDNIFRPAARPGFTAYSTTSTDRTQLCPRIGFSWQPLIGTVVRGGYGIFFEPEGTSGRVNRNILPFLLAETVNQTTNVVPNCTTANFFVAARFSIGESGDQSNAYHLAADGTSTSLHNSRAKPQDIIRVGHGELGLHP